VWKIWVDKGCNVVLVILGTEENKTKELQICNMKSTPFNLTRVSTLINMHIKVIGFTKSLYKASNNDGRMNHKLFAKIKNIHQH